MRKTITHVNAAEFEDAFQKASSTDKYPKVSERSGSKLGISRIQVGCSLREPRIIYIVRIRILLKVYFLLNVFTNKNY